MSQKDKYFVSPTGPIDQATDNVDDRMADEAQLKGRRRALRLGVAAPAILSLASQSALGAACLSPSRTVSGNTSFSQQGTGGQCNGVSPGNYKTQTQPKTNPSGKQSNSSAYNWPHGCNPCTLFFSVFAAGNYASQYYTSDPMPDDCAGQSGGLTYANAIGQRSMTMLEVLDLEGNGDPNKVAFHVVGAYLNILNGWISEKALTEVTLKGMWREYAEKGYYEPAANVKWYGGDIVHYLSTNTIAP